MIEVKKKDGESTEALIRRFNRQVQQSRLIIRAKKQRFYEPPKNRRALRDLAKRRQEARAHREYLRKIGKLDEQPRGRRKGFGNR